MTGWFLLAALLLLIANAFFVAVECAWLASRVTRLEPMAELPAHCVPIVEYLGDEHGALLPPPDGEVGEIFCSGACVPLKPFRHVYAEDGGARAVSYTHLTLPTKA